jgi:hypothetical protein
MKKGNIVLCWFIGLLGLSETNLMGISATSTLTAPLTDAVTTMAVAGGAAAAPPGPGGPTVTLVWGDSSTTNLAVRVQQSSDLTAPVSSWPTLGVVTNANSLTVPAISPANFFTASVVGQFITVLWNYPTDQLSPSLLFKLYWRPNPVTGWVLTTTLPGTNLSAQVYTPNNSGEYALTAVSAGTESSFSNVASWTNSVGSGLPLQIKTP